MTDAAAEIQMREIIAARLFPKEWADAGDKNRIGQQRRKGLRDRAEDVLAGAARIIAAEEKPGPAATKPINVRVAGMGDVEPLLVLIRESDDEAGLAPRDLGKVREIVGLAVDRQPLLDVDGTPLMRPVFGIVDGPNGVEAACGLYPTEPWDSWNFYLRGFYFHVRLESRHSSHAKSLQQFANWFGDRTGMAVVWEVLNCRRFDERDRMFSRYATPFGGLFIHRAVA